MIKSAINKGLAIIFPRYFGIGSGRGWLSRERKKIIDQAFTYTKNEEVRGDYLEFGVARGRTLIFAYEAAYRPPPPLSSFRTKVIGFDSFEGFPEPKNVDKIFERFKEGQENHGGIEVVHRALRRHGVELDKIKLVKGFYSDTLKDSLHRKLGVKKARVVNIDCDMYNSTCAVLRFITVLLQSGTVILFDDWLCYRGDPNKGEQRATREWLEQNPNITLIPYRSYANVGQSFIVHIDGNPPEK